MMDFSQLLQFIMADDQPTWFKVAGAVIAFLFVTRNIKSTVSALVKDLRVEMQGIVSSISKLTDALERVETAHSRRLGDLESDVKEIKRAIKPDQ